MYDIKEARIIKGLFEENNIDTEIYNEIEGIYKETECDIIFIDVRAVQKKDEKKSGNKKAIGRNTHLVLIVPFWMSLQEAQKIGKALGFRSINYIRRPITPQEILEHYLKLCGKKNF